MGSSEFETGSYRDSLKRIFARGMESSRHAVRAFDRDIEIHLLHGKGFPADKYKPHLEALLSGKGDTLEYTYLDQAAKIKLGLVKPEDSDKSHINAWFDVDNDVIITLEEPNAAILKRILSEVEENLLKKTEIGRVINALRNALSKKKEQIPAVAS
ncbi:hypothetical protein MUP32_00750 [Candidatus Microgenomates bacterium]|nr:hypothetical protein [Candidatus Microgenomates bacterium]